MPIAMLLLAGCASRGALIREGVPSASCLGAPRRLPGWPLRSSGEVTPIAIWIDATVQLDAAAAAQQGIATWNHVKLPVRLTRVGAPSEARVRVRFVRRLPTTAGLESPAGVTRLTTDDAGDHLSRADIYLARETPDGVPFSSNDLYVTAIHELGHALGVGHGTNPATVMAPTTRAVGFTSVDAQLARDAYAPCDARPIAARDRTAQPITSR